MESSSEESFVWTDASSDSSNGTIMQSNMNGDNQSAEESECSIKYKKKLQKEIFSSGINGIETPKASKRKITYEQSDSDCEDPAPRNKIKVEPESDHEKHKKKRKSTGSNRDTSEGESYLNMKVKKEHRMSSPEVQYIRKSKRQQDSEEERLEEQLAIKSKREEQDLSLKVSDDAEEQTDLKKNKRKKKKSKKRSNSSETKIYTDETLNSESNITEKVRQNEITLNSSLEQSKDEISIIEKVNSSQYENILTESLTTRKDENDGDKTLSNRLQESSADVTSSMLQKFAKTNSHLKAVMGHIQNEAAITREDEIWLIQCPRQVDPNSFQNKKLTLEGKCKVKIDGHTYEGHTLPVDDRVGVMTTKHNQFIISTVPVEGVLQLRRRLPKPHLQESNVVGNNIIDSIPLPVTKCRHPLFGAEYKDAINISAHIKEKLKTAYCETPTVLNVKKKKKHKKEKQTIEQGEDRTEISRKQKRKKIEQDNEGQPYNKIKRRKQEINSSEAWESEKAIEQNLFSF